MILSQTKDRNPIPANGTCRTIIKDLGIRRTEPAAIELIKLCQKELKRIKRIQMDTDNWVRLLTAVIDFWIVYA